MNSKKETKNEQIAEAMRKLASLAEDLHFEIFKLYDELDDAIMKYELCGLRLDAEGIKYKLNELADSLTNK